MKNLSKFIAMLYGRHLAACICFASLAAADDTHLISTSPSPYLAGITEALKGKVVSFGAGSTGYTLTIAYLGVVVALYVIYWFSRLVRCNSLKDNKMFIPELQLTQRGFVDSKFGSSLQILSFLLVLWLHVAMFMAIIGHYKDQWPFDLSLAPGTVDWDSFTRVFIATWLGSITFACLMRIFRHRMDSFYLRPSSLSSAQYVKFSQILVESTSSEKDLNVLHEEVVPVRTTPVRHVDFLLKKFVWSDSDGMFSPGYFFASHLNHPKKMELDNIKQVGGLSPSSASDRLSKYGRNELELSVPSFVSMILDELSSTFFLYQIYGGCLLSLYWDYITAGILCFLLIITSASIKVFMERREKLLLRDMATLRGSVWVKREGHWTRVTSEELVIGDLICLSDDSFDISKEITVDCVLVTGNAVVDESTLTGETMPVQKHSCDSILDKSYTLSPHSPDCIKHYLFAGTWLLQATDAADNERPGSVSSGALAVVTATGGSTMRGELIKSLVYGKPAQSVLTMEFRVAISILIVLANINFWIVNASYEATMASLLPAITSLVGLISPLLTVALVGGEIRAAGRLSKSEQVHVKDVHRLTMAGKTDLVLLDKTGTITKTGLEFRGVVPSHSLRLTECSSKDSPVPMELSVCLALAHSVARVNGVLVGHQVELHMIEAASKLGWKFSSDMRAPVDPGGNLWEVERLFPFSHESMIMSAVVVQRSSSKRVLVAKGSFEAIKPRCLDVTEEISRACALYSQDGYYVVATAMELIENEHDSLITSRSMSFQGFLLFRNEIKPHSSQVMGELKKSGIETVVLTGDSVFTATAVARQTNIISSSTKVVIGVIDSRSHEIEYRIADTDSRISEESLAGDNSAVLCVSGDVFEALKRSGKLDIDRIKVFGRVSPVQKAEIVSMYALEGRHVMMVGDGANDSMALKTAHCGLAINSLAEANVAAPFSTARSELTAIVSVIKEARCAVSTSLAAYRYLIAMGMIQTITKTILYLQCGGFVSGVASLFIDCLQVPIMLYCICSALPANQLAPSPPEGSLLGPEMIIGVIWSVFSAVVTIAVVEGILVNADWFVGFFSDAPLSSWRERIYNQESSLVVILRLWLYTDLALVYSYGSVHRRSLVKNWKLLIACALVFGLVGYLLFGPVGVPQAAFVVEINKAAALEAGSTVFNQFLFYYERIGGVWFGMADSIQFPKNFKIALVAVLVVTSIIHHLGFKLAVTGPVTKWFHERIGWKDGSCACCRRRRYRGYKPIGIQLTKADALDESINHAADEDSPATEWELRRTYGRWRAPTEPEYH